MGKKGYDGKTAFKAGLAYDKETGKGIDELVDLQAREAECGCGIDCCEKELVLTDQVTGHAIAIYISDSSVNARDKVTGSVVVLGVLND